MNPYVDSDEEVFFGPVTPREVQLLKQRGLDPLLEKKLQEEVTKQEDEAIVAAPATDNMEEGKKELTRDDFDCTMDYMEYVMAEGEDEEEEDWPGNSAGKENIAPEPVVPMEEMKQNVEHDELVQATVDRCPTPMPVPLAPPPENPIVLGPFSPITPDVSFQEQDRALPDVVVAASPRAFASLKAPVAIQVEVSVPEASAVQEAPPRDIAPETPSQAPSSSTRRVEKPANIRFVTSDKPAERRAAPKRPLPAPASASSRKGPRKPPVLKPKGASAFKVNPSPSPVRQYIDGVVDRLETTRTPLTKRFQLPQVEVITPTTVKPPTVEVPRSGGKTTVFPRLGEIKSAGRLVVDNNKEATGVKAYVKLGRVPIEVDGESQEYSVYEAQ